jgi:hypothetical protein
MEKKIAEEGGGSILFGVVMFVSLGLRLPLAESGPCALLLRLRVGAHLWAQGRMIIYEETIVNNLQIQPT